MLLIDIKFIKFKYCNESFFQSYRTYGDFVIMSLTLDDLFSQVSNRRARRWINDRILLELVPRLTGDEIRGLFAPPPFGNVLLFMCID